MPWPHINRHDADDDDDDGDGARPPTTIAPNHEIHTLIYPQNTSVCVCVCAADNVPAKLNVRTCTSVRVCGGTVHAHTHTALIYVNIYISLSASVRALVCVCVHVRRTRDDGGDILS